MSGIISYVKRIGVWLCIVIACETIMIITMMLNKIPFAEIGYGIFISLFLLLILLAFDAMRYYRHYQKVKELEHTIMLSTDGMPEMQTCWKMSTRSFFGYYRMNIQGRRAGSHKTEKYAGILCHVGSPGQDTDRSTAASASE